MVGKNLKAFLAVLSLGLPSLYSCGGDITGSLSLDSQGADYLTYADAEGNTQTLDPSDSVFYHSITSFPTYVGTAGSQLPQKIKTAKAVKDGYHFSGWGQKRSDGTIGKPLLTDFSTSAVPFSAVTYSAVFAKESSVTFQAIDTEQDIASVVLQGADYYYGVLLNMAALENVLTTFNAELAVDSQTGQADGTFTGIYADEDGSGDPLTSITVSDAPTTYYVKFSAYPELRIHYGGVVSDPSPLALAPGTSLAGFEPDVSSLGIPSHYRFSGWYYDSDLTSGFVFDDVVSMGDSDLDVYAKFERKIPIELDYGADEQLVDSTSFDATKEDDGNVYVWEGEAFDDSILPSVEASGRTFEFWYYDADGNGVFDTGTDIKFDGSNTAKVPTDLEKLVLEPEFSQWGVLYVDLGTDQIVPSNSLGLEQAPDQGQGVYSVSLASGTDLSAYLDVSNYTAPNDLSIDGIKEVTIDGTVSSSPTAGSITSYTMPGNDVAFRLVTSSRYKVTLNWTGGSSEIYIRQSDGTIFDWSDLSAYGVTVPDIPVTDLDYVARTLRGWSDTQGGAGLSLPYTIAGDESLWAVYANKVLLTFRDGADGVTVGSYEGVEGDEFPLASYIKTLYPGREVSGFVRESDGQVVSTIDVFPEFNETYVPLFAD